MKTDLMMGLALVALASMTFAMPVSGQDAPGDMQPVDIVEAEVRWEYKCDSRLSTCDVRTSGFHRGLPTMQGTSQIATSSAACVIITTTCTSEGPVFLTVPRGCYLGHAQTAGLAYDTKILCLP